ncbi:MAG: glycosyltransferase family 39 protein [Lentisphaerae bacterium]|nr:glycosyltransferase family 39 protein [Lentisphaerota bacterium]
MGTGLSCLSRRRAAAAVWILAALVLAAGSVYAFQLKDRLRYPDERDYVALAARLAGAGRYSLDGQNPTAFRPPGYPLLLAAAARLGGGIVAFRLLNFALLGLTLPALFGLVRRQHGDAAGLLAALLPLGYPVLFYSAGTLYPQTLAACLFVTVLALVFGTANPGASRTAGAGLLGGWLVLTVPTFGFALALLAAWLSFEKRIRQAALLLAAAALVVAPWVARNARAFDAFVLVSSNSGVNLLLGNCETTTPNGGTTVDISAYRARAEGLDEIERNRFYTRRALAWIRAHPRRALRLYALKFLNYFNFRNELYVRREGTAPRDLAMLLTYGLLLALTAARLAASRRRPLTRFERFALLLYVLNGAFAALFFTRIRFRLPFDYLLIGTAAGLMPHGKDDA